MVSRQNNIFVPHSGRRLRPAERPSRFIDSRPITFIRRVDAKVNRCLKRLFCVPVCIVLVILAGVAIFEGARVYFKYAAMIDMRLQGRFFDNSSGMYSAPRTINRGAELSESDLVGYLRRAAYVDDGSVK